MLGARYRPGTDAAHPLTARALNGCLASDAGGTLALALPMQIPVTLYATLRLIAGTKTVQVEHADGMTVWDLVHTLIAQHPPLGPQLLDSDGNLWRHVHVMVNGRDAPYLERGMDTPIRTTDKLDVFPPVGGGQE